MGLVSNLRNNMFVYRIYRTFLMAIKRKKYGLRNVHPTFFMAGKSLISKDFRAAEYSFIGDGCRIGPGVSIGAYVMFGPHVTVTGADHRFDIPGTPMIFSGRPKLEKTIIEADSWIGYGSVIMSGVHIGRGSIVAANSVVTKDIPPYEIHGGVPAKKIRGRFQSQADIDIHEEMLKQPPRCGVFTSPLK
jgi:acetyltransferase-like isoleucine patch superfamily enzyme